MNEEKFLKDSYGSMELPETDMYKAVIGRLSAPKKHRKIGIKPTVLLIIIITFVFSTTAVAVTVLNPTRSYFHVFYPEDAYDVDIRIQFKYAMEAYNANKDDNFNYTREQIKELYNSGVVEVQHSTNIRQPHFQPESLKAWLNPDVNNTSGPLELCNNTYYMIYEGRRVCTTCGYVFTLEQDKEIGLEW